MIARKIPRVTLIALTLGIALFALPDVLAASEKSASKDAKNAAKAAKVAAKKASKSSKSESIDSSATKSDDIAIIRTQISKIGKGLAAGDANHISSVWAEDATYIDSDGVVTRGKNNLERRFAALIAEYGRPHFVLIPDNVRLISSNVGLSEGIVRRQNGVNGPTPETRYSMVFVKQDGNWYISSATETPLVVQDSGEALKQLSWLVGEWSANNNGGSVHMKSEWAADKHFIQCRFEMQKSADAKPVESRQIIGWDPRSQQIVSWHFDSNGGFGYGTWIKRDNQWSVAATGVQPDGTTSNAMNLFTVADGNSFTWQSVDRSVDGVAIGDTAPLKVLRVGKLSSVEKATQ